MQAGKKVVGKQNTTMFLHGMYFISVQNKSTPTHEARATSWKKYISTMYIRGNIYLFSNISSPSKLTTCYIKMLNIIIWGHKSLVHHWTLLLGSQG